MTKLFLAALCLCASATIVRATEPVDQVSTLIGAKAEGGNLGGGKTFPGAALPFGMVQLSPDTITGGDNGPGYSFYGKTIEGFSFTHMSGVGAYGDLGNLQVMPTTGPLQFQSGSNGLDLYQPENKDGWKSPYAHTDEVALAGYYAVTLDRYKVRAEMTATTHAGILQFTFPADAAPRIQIDLARRIGGRAREEYAKLVDDHTLEGWMRYEGDGRGFAAKTRYTFYFRAEFDQPIATHGFWNKGDDLGSLPEKQADDLGFYANFKSGTATIHMKAGISFVSIANAAENLKTELPDFDFEKVRIAAREKWAAELAKIKIEGGSEKDRVIFYSALYHTLLDPRTFQDVNGDFFGADKKTHRTERYTQRTIFSGWDVFRSEFPLLTLIHPDVVSDEINSLMHVAETNGTGVLPRWELLNTESGVMVGNPAVVIIADAWRKNIRSFDLDRAYADALATEKKSGNGDLGYTSGQISRTLEYAFDDWCMARLATAVNKPDVAQTYDEKSATYKKIWDPAVSWFHGEKADGSFIPWLGREKPGQGCVESNPYQQGWFVPHDVPGLITLMGGDEKFCAELQTFFEKTPTDFLWNDYYNHPNEPCHHVPFLFVYAGQPWRTQFWTRAICDRAYGLGADGLCGNEDVGQMSAWYVLASIGIHPVNPADGTFILTSPVFTKATIHLDPTYASGKTFIITAKNNSPENVYIQSATLNGKPLDRAWLTWEEITNGGTLDLTMGAQPNKDWGNGKDVRPPHVGAFAQTK